MQKDNRGTIASLTPQIGLPRPSSTWDLQGIARTTAWHADGGGRGAPLHSGLQGVCASSPLEHGLATLEAALAANFSSKSQCHHNSHAVLVHIITLWVDQLFLQSLFGYS